VKYVIPKDSRKWRPLEARPKDDLDTSTVLTFFQTPGQIGTKPHFMPKGVKLALFPEVQKPHPGMSSTVLVLTCDEVSSLFGFNLGWRPLYLSFNSGMEASLPQF